MAEQSEQPKSPQAVPMESVGKPSFWYRFKSAVGLNRQPPKSQVRPLTPEERQSLDQKLGPLPQAKEGVQAQLQADQVTRNESYRNRSSLVNPRRKGPSTKQKVLLTGAGMAAGAIAGAAALGGLSGRSNETPNPSSPDGPAHTQTMETIPSMQTPVGTEEAKRESDEIRNRLSGTPTSTTSTPTQIPADAGAPETFEKAQGFVPNTGKPKP